MANQDQPQNAQGKQKNEGEGNRTAAREYNQKTREFVQSGRVQPAAEKAKQAVEGKEGAELQSAEDAGRARAKGEDPALRRR